MKIKLSKKIGKDFASFLEYHPPQQFSSHLRSVFLDYLHYCTRAGTSPLFLNNFLWSINDFFDLLDTAAREFPPKSKTE